MPAAPQAEGWLDVFPRNGFSGMALLGADTYLVVHDTKSYQDPMGTRFGLLQVRKDDGIRYRALVFDAWDAEGPANDLEAVCALEGRPGEALAIESGYSESKKGRIFHVKVEGEMLSMVGVYKLPFLLDNGPKLRGDNFEGLSCPRRAEGGYWLILGERGASQPYKNGFLRWGTLDLDKGQATYTEAGKAGIELAPPGNWPSEAKPRAISDLYLDPRGVLWSVATADQGDDGPYRSLVYPAATFTGKDQPFELADDREARWVVDGIKIEALASGVGSSLAYATEDEHLGGIWRPLYAPIRP